MLGEVKLWVHQVAQFYNGLTGRSPPLSSLTLTLVYV